MVRPALPPYTEVVELTVSWKVVALVVLVLTASKMPLMKVEPA